MLMKLLPVFSVLVFFHTTVEGRYRIALLTDIEDYSITKHWVGVKAYGSKGEKTSWMYPRFQTHTGTYDYNDINDKSVNDMTSIDIQLEKSGIRLHPDAWKGAKVVINDFVTGKVFEASDIGWVNTGEVKNVPVKLVADECKDIDPVDCKCIREGPREKQFELALGYFKHCLKTCKICYSLPPDPKARRDEEASGDVKAADEGDHEGELEDEDEGPDKHEQEHEDEKE